MPGGLFFSGARHEHTTHPGPAAHPHQTLRQLRRAGVQRAGRGRRPALRALRASHTMSRRKRTRRDKRAPIPDFDEPLPL